MIIKDSSYKPIPKRVVKYIRETHDSFTIRLDWKLKHEPGQFVFCSLPGIGEAPISICSYSDKYIELNIREVGNVTNALSKIQKGDRLLVRGPYGTSYPMDIFKEKNIVIVGGGCGVAPLKGVIEYIEKNRDEFMDTSLFFGFRTPEDTLFKNKFDDWNKTFNMKVMFDSVPKGSCYSDSKGFITNAVINDVDDPTCIALLCGPPIMIEKTAEILINKGFDEERIFISAERLMYCGMGKCGRCMIHGKYTCLDGAVFRYDELKDYRD